MPEETGWIYRGTILCLLDYEKAFDNFKRRKMWSILIEIMDTPKHFVYLVKKLYLTNKGYIKLEGGVNSKYDKNAVHRRSFLTSIVNGL